MLLLIAAPASRAGTGEGPPRSLLLIAAAHLQDPNFARSVVLVTQTPRGPFGFILNRPLPLTVGEALPGAAGAVASLPVHFGGPVARQAIGVLFGAEGEPPDALRVMDETYASLSQGVIDQILRAPEPPSNLRFFAGYAGWAPGQLERELERGDWSVWPADEGSVFEIPATEMWPVLHRRASARRADAAAGVLAARRPAVFRGALLEHLEEDLVLADHAELDPGPLLDRGGALLEVPHLGIEGCVARAQPRVMRALLLQPPLQIAHRGPATLAHPQRILQRGEEDDQGGGEQLH